MVSERIVRFLKVIEDKNPRLNAVLSVNNNAAQQEGAGVLAGKGIIVKANICVKGLESNCASKVLEGFIAPYDATVIRRLKAEGAVILGMANCDEFASGSTGENSAFGPAQNPAAPGRVPGGSSSGSAVAVAAGMCDAALGSETGGSIRNPASHCGVIGFKPSYGAVSRHGLIDLSMSLDAIGVFARDVQTLANVMTVIAGPDENDARTLSDVDMRIPNEALKGKRIGIVPKLRSLCADGRIYDAVDKKVRDYAQAAGAEIVEIDLPHIENAVQTYYPLVFVEFFSGTRKFDGRKYGKKIEEHCGEEVLRRILGGKEISRAEYQGKYYRLALRMRDIISKGINDAFAKVDFIAMPVTPRLPHVMGERLDPREEYAYDAFTIPANLAGICAASYPIGTIDEIPLGMQILAPRAADARLIGALKHMEEVDHARSKRSEN